MALPPATKPRTRLYQPQADINVTPLVDVMLVLLIIFMVTAPLLAAGVKVEPAAGEVRAAARSQGADRRHGGQGRQAVARDGRDCRPIASSRRSRPSSARIATRVVRLRGDKDAAYGDVVAVMDLLASNGITHIAIVTGPKSREKATGERGGGGQAVSQAGAIASAPPDLAETQAEWAVRPAWLRPAAIVLALALHAAAAAFVAAPVLPASPTDAIDVTLVAQGDAAEERQALAEVKPAEAPAPAPLPLAEAPPPPAEAPPASRRPRTRRAAPLIEAPQAVPLALAKPEPSRSRRPSRALSSSNRSTGRRRRMRANSAASRRRRRSGDARRRRLNSPSDWGPSRPAPRRPPPRAHPMPRCFRPSSTATRSIRPRRAPRA